MNLERSLHVAHDRPTRAAATAQLQREYEQLSLIRATLGFRVMSARRKSDGRWCVLVTAAPHLSSVEAARALDRAAWAHGVIEHRCVPRTTKRVLCDGRPLLELDAHAVGDGIELMRLCSTRGVRLPLPAADALIVGVRRALEAAHRVIDPETGAPLCLGRLSAANLLFSPEGQTWVIGFGHNVALEDPSGSPDPHIAYFAAPEFNLGSPPTPTGDYAALLMFLRANLSVVDKRGALSRVFRAVTSRTDDALLELMLWFERRVIGAHPSERATIVESVQVSDRVRALLGLVPDPALLERFVSQLFMDPSASMLQRSMLRGPQLEVGPEAEWVRVDDGAIVRLRGPMRRVLLALAERQQSGLMTPVRSVELAELAWPDETLSIESSLNRLYVTINRLRRMLPSALIERHDDGYRLSARYAVRICGG